MLDAFFVCWKMNIFFLHKISKVSETYRHLDLSTSRLESIMNYRQICHSLFFIIQN